MPKLPLLPPLLFLCMSLPLIAQVVHIPDFNFKNALLNNLSINTNNDTEWFFNEHLANKNLKDYSITKINQTEKKSYFVW